MKAYKTESKVHAEILNNQPKCLEGCNGESEIVHLPPLQPAMHVYSPLDNVRGLDRDC